MLAVEEGAQMAEQNQTNNTSNSVRLNTIGLGPTEVEELLERMSLTSRSSGVDEFRAFMRWPLQGVTAEFELEENGSYRGSLNLATRNISNSGISLLHSAFFYPGSRCRVTLPLREDPKVTVSLLGVIMRCIHVEGVVHEIGIKFDTVIDSSRFVSKLMTSQGRPEIAKPKNLSGRVLHIDSSAVDRKLIEYFLSLSKIQLVAADTIEKARSLVQEPFDLILCELVMPDGDGTSLIQWMRDQCISTPVAIHSATPANQVRDKIDHLEVQGFLPKPIDRTTLITAMTEFLSLPRNNERRESHPVLNLDDPAVKQIVSLFRSEIDTLIESLSDETLRADAMHLYSVTLRLQGTAPTLGFTQLGKVAGRAAESLAATMSSEESAPQLDALLDCCRTARAA
ncbi:MAG: hypothetical protein Phyf2KO_17690 [Phycisphaerales bacterium]